MPPFRRFPFFPAGLLGCFPFFPAGLLRRFPFITTYSLRRCQIFPAEPFGFRPVTATVSAVKIIGQQLWYSEDGQHDGDVGCALKVL